MALAFGPVTPVLRILDEAKAREFYVEFLGFTVQFEHRFHDNAPLVLGVERGGFEMHLTEHHGDGTPGAHIRVQVSDVNAYVRELSAKKYRYANPGECTEPNFNGNYEIMLTDPFSNRIAFWQPAPG